MNSKTNLLIAGLAVVALAAGYLLFYPAAPKTGASGPVAVEGGAESTAPAKMAPAITVAATQKTVLRDTIRSSGLVGAVERILVQPQIEGQAIDSIDAEVGDHVAAGAVLARLSEMSLKLQKAQLVASRASAMAAIATSEAQMVEAQSSAQEAHRTEERSRELQKQGNASQATADQAKTAAVGADARVLVTKQSTEAARAQLDVVDAQIDNVDLQLSRTQIKAPFAGEVVERNAVRGAIASAAGAPMFVLVRDGLLELRAKLRVAGSDVPLTGTVRLVEPAIDTVTRLGRARIAIDQADRIRTGMFLEAEITVSEREVLSVPITALGTDEKGAFVMAVDPDGKVRRATVVTGIRDGKLVEVKSGLDEGELVVAKAASFVRDGDVIDPISAADAPVTN
jgi:HlyD family secretion protein